MEESGKYQIKDKVKEFLRDNYNLALVVLVIFVVISRLYYFFLLKNQPIWWDEGDYLSVAKIMALNLPKPEWWGHFTGIRPMFVPLLWAGMFKLGFGEMAIRFFTLVLPSIGVIIMCYLLGKEMYDKRVGLIAGVMMAFYWVFGFYTYRFLTDIPAILFGLLCVYFFWTHYIKRNKPMGLYLSALFGVLAFSSRFPLALVLVSCAIYLLFVKRLSLFKDKTIWKGLMWTLIFLLPYIIFFIYTKFQTLIFYFGAGSGTANDAYAWYVIPLFTSLFHNLWLIAFVLGILSLYTVLLYFDLIWKQKDTSFNSDLLIIIWLVVHFAFYIFFIRGANDRWLLMLMPASFILAGKGLMELYKILSNYSKQIGFIIIMIILLGGAYQNITHSHSLIMDKKDTYKELKLSGEWLKENTPKDAKIITASIVQHFYYSERQTYNLEGNGSELLKSCVDKLGNLALNESCQNESKRLFEEKTGRIKPDYYIISAFEPVFTPAWAYTYAEDKNLTLVNAYFMDEQQTQPILLVYNY